MQQVLKNLNDLERNQLPFAGSLALNATGKDVIEENQRLMDKVFDRPTRWTRNAFWLRRSTKRNLIASVERKTAISRRFYLEIQAEGGTRRKTGIERLLINKLSYPGGIEAIVPTRGQRRNRYGNVSPAAMNRILAGLKVQLNNAQSSGKVASSQAGARRARYFVPAPGSKLSPGVFEQRGTKLKKVLAFSQSRARYTARFPMQSHGQAYAKRVLPAHFRTALNRALSTAKR